MHTNLMHFMVAIVLALGCLVVNAGEKDIIHESEPVVTENTGAVIPFFYGPEYISMMMQADSRARSELFRERASARHEAFIKHTKAMRTWMDPWGEYIHERITAHNNAMHQWVQTRHDAIRHMFDNREAQIKQLTAQRLDQLRAYNPYYY